MFHLIGQLFFGLMVGMLARLVLPGKDHIGVVATAIMGLLGSMIGTFLGRAIFGSEHHTAGWIAATLGTIAVLIVFKFVTGNGVRQTQSLYSAKD